MTKYYVHTTNHVFQMMLVTYIFLVQFSFAFIGVQLQSRELFQFLPSFRFCCNNIFYQKRRQQQQQPKQPMYHYLESSMSMSGTDENDGFSSSDRDDNDEYYDPDSMGVKVDGFPLPETPILDNHQELLDSIRRVQISTAMDSPLKSRNLPDVVQKNKRRRQQQQQQQSSYPSSSSSSSMQPLRVIIAGGGLGGLALASTLIQKGFDVHVYEQARQYKPFGGPIQIQSNALWALNEINPALYEAVKIAGVQTGDRLSGIKDGIRCQQQNEDWLVKFDAATPAIKCGLPLTLAINRVVLQDIFLTYGIPKERIHTSQRVIGYTEASKNNSNSNSKIDNDFDHGVAVHLEDGTTIYGDILVGADGIWSRVRHKLYNLPPNEVGPKFASKHAKYSGYTCFTGTCKHTPNDIDQVAYKVFLGQEKYFGCTDCGYGWQHWWAFLPGNPSQSSPYATSSSNSSNNNNNNVDDESSSIDFLNRLKYEFKDWSNEIHDLFHATNPNVVKSRELYDRLPLYEKGWISNNGNVVLLGDAAHPTMPNLGQGGAMAIEDSYVLGQELESIQHTNEIYKRLKSYEKRRFIRASIAQFLSRNGSDLLVDWETLRTTPIIGPIGMWFVNIVQPITMNYLYSADI